jgi:hypothetical protein
VTAINKRHKSIIMPILAIVRIVPAVGNKSIGLKTKAAM